MHITCCYRICKYRSTVTVNGTEQDNLTVSGNNNSRILNVTDGGDLTLSSISLVNGSSYENYSPGGAIFVNDSSLIIDNSSLSNNISFGSGGAIHALSSTVIINNSSISNNLSYTGGGAIFCDSSTATINNSTLSNNTASFTSGGGILLFNSDTININNSTFSNNSAFFTGGGIYVDATYININKSTFLNNFASFGGGGIASPSADRITIINNTISNNSANYNGISIGAAGINIESANTVIIKNNTVTGNSSTSDNSGGLNINTVNSLVISNNIISENIALTSNEIQLSAISSSSILNNIIGSNKLESTSAFSGFTPDSTNIIGTNDALNLSLNQIIEPLANNGGSTLTHALSSDSPALNSGNNIDCPTTDQRGEPRDDGFCDIGSFEGTSEQTTYFTIPLNNDKTVIFGL